MNPLPVRSKRLRHRAVRTTNGSLADVSLLPFFDESGVVRRVLLVDHERRLTSMLDWRPDLVRVPWRRPVELDAAAQGLRPLSEYQASGARGLWHDDPAWLLGDVSRAGEAAGALLLATNGAGRWSVSLGSLYFRRDLSRICLVSIRQAGGLQWAGWKPRYLPSRPATTLACSREDLPLARRRWVLDPIWQR